MASLFSSLLRATNRKKNARLNILCINEDESFQAILAETNHMFYFLQLPQSKPWDKMIRPIPSNCSLLHGKEANDQLKQDIQFDIILCQNRMTQFPLLYKIAKQLSCPIMIAENSLSVPEMNPFEVEALQNQPYNTNVFHSEFLTNSWGFEETDDDTFVIPYGVDTNLFDGWMGGDGKILTIVNNYAQRSSVTGFDTWTEVTKGLPTNQIGDKRGSPKQTKNLGELLSLYKNASVFLNTSAWISCPKTILEAMSVGCPIVTTATTSLSDIIKDGVNGYISHNPDELREKLIFLLENPEKGLELGMKARETIKENFGIETFVSSFNNAFEATVGRVSSALVGGM